MKILFVNTAGYIGGGEKSLLEFLRFLPSDIERHLLCPADSRLARSAEESGAYLHPWHYGRIRNWEWLKFTACIVEITGLLKKYRFDLIQANSFPAAVHISLAAKLNKIPLIAVVRDIANFSFISTRLLTLADIIVANSHSTANNLSNLKIPKDKIRVIYNGFDFSNYNLKLPVYSPNHQSGGIIYTGQLQHRKGIDILILAFKKVLETRPQAVLKVVGDDLSQSGRLTGEYKSLVNSLGIEKSVIFTGFVEDVVEQYVNSDVLVLPSRNEPFGRVLVEAMAAGLPVVASNIGGIPEIIKDDTVGVLVPPEDPDALAQAILNILEAGGRSSPIALKGQEYVRCSFTMEKQIEAYLKLYQELVNKR